jgi:hypothetical protein
VGLKNLKHAPTYTSSKDLKNGNCFFHEARWFDLHSCVNGKSTKWCCQGWPKWKFQNGEGLMEGFNKIKGQIWMNNICMKIVGMTSGNGI